MICKICTATMPCWMCHYFKIETCGGCDYNRKEAGIEKENPGDERTGGEAATTAGVSEYRDRRNIK